jgi:hypothetical protein
MMRSTITAIALCCLALAGCQPRGAMVGSPSASAESTIRARLQSTADGWNRGDLAAYMAVYDSSSAQMGANGAEHGPAIIEATMKRGFWKTGRPLQQLRYENVEFRPLGAHHALVTGKFVLTGADRPQRSGVFSSVWTDESGEWRMIWDHSG